MRLQAIVSAFLAAVSAGGALANDSTAEMGTGGLVLGRSEEIAMVSEDLFISPKEVRVRYVFRNEGKADIDTIVAFPMPEIQFTQDTMIAVPDGASDNFLGFTVTMDGVSVMPQLQQRAIASGVDVTAAVLAAGLPLQAMAPEGEAAFAALTPESAGDLAANGAIGFETFDDGSGWKTVAAPRWKLESTYWWRSTFPAGRDVVVEHSYKPSIGSTAGLPIISEYIDEAELAGYARRYCTDDDFINSVEKRNASANSETGPYFEHRISYVLRTGANWARSIGTFHLTIDKGAPENLVSFCGEGVTKTGPTTFELTAKDFWPERDLDILLIARGEF